MTSKKGISFFEPSIEIESSLAVELQPFIDAERGSGPVSDMIELRVHEVTELMAKLIAAETPVNLGVLAAGIAQSGSVSYGKKAWYGEVTDGGVPYSIPVEFGVQPFKNKGPSKDMIRSLELWILRRQLKWFDKAGRAMSPNQMAWALGWHIAKTGTDGTEMFLKGVQQAKPHVEKILAGLMDDIEAWWDRGQNA